MDYQLPQLFLPVKATRVVVFGSRKFERYDLVIELLLRLAKARPDITIITGGAQGPDSWAAQDAIGLGLKLEQYPAKWRTPGSDRVNRAAGLQRNELMADACDVGFGFWDGKSTGTDHMFSCLRERRKPYTCINQQGGVTYWKHNGSVYIPNVDTQAMMQ
jgi:hypothetical protein